MTGWRADVVQANSFPVDGKLMMVLPRAAASMRNPDVRRPTLSVSADGYYLEMRVEADAEEASEFQLTRRISLDDLSSDQWEELKLQCENVDLNALSSDGLAKGLEGIQDRRVKRLFTALLTFLNPRQVSIVLYFYKLAAEQDDGAVVTFRSNDLLEALGYKRSKEGSFTAKQRSQLNQDLVALHRIELLFAETLQDGDLHHALVTVKSILRIRSYFIDNVPRDFDLTKAADYTYELADAYTVALEFFEGTKGANDFVCFPASMDLRQKQGKSASNNYKLKLLTYLASRLRWDKLKFGNTLTISKRYLLKNLDLLGSNKSRNNSILWRTIDELIAEGYVTSANEISGKRKTMSIEFQVAPEKLSTGLD